MVLHILNFVQSQNTILGGTWELNHSPVNLGPRADSHEFPRGVLSLPHPHQSSSLGEAQCGMAFQPVLTGLLGFLKRAPT